MDTPAEQHEIRFEIEGLISLLAQNLYADPDVFLREMIQNAHDSIVKRRELAQERRDTAHPAGLIRIRANREERTLTIEDNGSGLTRDEIHRYLATIGGSGTRELRKTLADRDHRSTIDLIGQFGIGILSAFIVAERVAITTRSPLERPLLWTSDGGKHYRLEETERDQVGSTVVLHLKQDNSRYLDLEKLRGIVRRYADFIDIPVHLGGETEPANAVKAPWHRQYGSPKETRAAHHAYWEGRFHDEHSLDILPIDEAVTCPDPKQPGGSLTTRVRGVLGITDRHIPDVNTRGTVDVYVLRMFVASGNREVLPPWARFIQGVIECDALTPNAARDDVVRNDLLAAVRETLGRLILEWLTRLSAEDAPRFIEIMRWHDYHVLAMSVQDEHEGFFRAVADLMPLDSDQGPLTIKQYLDSAAALPNTGKRVVYYLTERGSTTQYYVLCAAKGIHVFNASGGFTERFLQRYAKLWPERVHLSRLDVSGSEAIFTAVDENDPERERFRELEVAYARVFPDLRCIAKVSRFRPLDLPAVLTESRDQKTRREMEDVSKNVVLPGFIRDLVKGLLKDNREPLSLHLNADNPTVMRLAKRATLTDAVARNALISIYNNAFMLLSRTITPQNIQVMFQQYSNVIDLMLTLADDAARLVSEKEALATRLRDVEGDVASSQSLARCVTCFVAMPFKEEAIQPVFAALQRVLEDVPYLWHVLRADHETRHETLQGSMFAHMNRAHCFVAEVSTHNPNVMLEIGRMQTFGRPIFLIKRKGSIDLPADLKGLLYAEYEGDGDKLVEEIREAVKRDPKFSDQRGERRLSVTLLREAAPDLGESARRKVAEAFETCEELLETDTEEIQRRTGLRAGAVQDVTEGVRERLRSMG